MDNRSTPLSAIRRPEPPPQQTPQGGVPPGGVPPGGGSAGFGQLPGGAEQVAQMQPGVPQPRGPSQGFSQPQGRRFEFFGLQEVDYKSTLIVFALVLIFSSNIFFESIGKYIPMVVQDGRTTMIGSLIAALLAALIFLVVKLLMDRFGK